VSQTDRFGVPESRKACVSGLLVAATDLLQQYDAMNNSDLLLTM
jgi:hypothetical protein